MNKKIKLSTLVFVLIVFVTLNSVIIAAYNDNIKIGMNKILDKWEQTRQPKLARWIEAKEEQGWDKETIERADPYKLYGVRYAKIMSRLPRAEHLSPDLIKRLYKLKPPYMTREQAIAIWPGYFKDIKLVGNEVFVEKEEIVTATLKVIIYNWDSSYGTPKITVKDYNTNNPITPDIKIDQSVDLKSKVHKKYVETSPTTSESDFTKYEVKWIFKKEKLAGSESQMISVLGCKKTKRIFLNQHLGKEQPQTFICTFEPTEDLSVDSQFITNSIDPTPEPGKITITGDEIIKHFSIDFADDAIYPHDLNYKWVVKGTQSITREGSGLDKVSFKLYPGDTVTVELFNRKEPDKLKGQLVRLPEFSWAVHKEQRPAQPKIIFANKVEQPFMPGEYIDLVVKDLPNTKSTFETEKELKFEWYRNGQLIHTSTVSDQRRGRDYNVLHYKVKDSDLGGQKQATLKFKVKLIISEITKAYTKKRAHLRTLETENFDVSISAEVDFKLDNLITKADVLYSEGKRNSDHNKIMEARDLYERILKSDILSGTEKRRIKDVIQEIDGNNKTPIKVTGIPDEATELRYKINGKLKPLVQTSGKTTLNLPETTTHFGKYYVEALKADKAIAFGEFNRVFVDGITEKDIEINLHTPTQDDFVQATATDPYTVEVTFPANTPQTSIPSHLGNYRIETAQTKNAVALKDINFDGDKVTIITKTALDGGKYLLTAKNTADVPVGSATFEGIATKGVKITVTHPPDRTFKSTELQAVVTNTKLGHEFKAKKIDDTTFSVDKGLYPGKKYNIKVEDDIYLAKSVWDDTGNQGKDVELELKAKQSASIKGMVTEKVHGEDIGLSGATVLLINGIIDPVAEAVAVTDFVKAVQTTTFGSYEIKDVNHGDYSLLVAVESQDGYTAMGPDMFETVTLEGDDKKVNFGSTAGKNFVVTAQRLNHQQVKITIDGTGYTFNPESFKFENIKIKGVELTKDMYKTVDYDKKEVFISTGANGATGGISFKQGQEYTVEVELGSGIVSYEKIKGKTIFKGMDTGTICSKTKQFYVVDVEDDLKIEGPVGDEEIQLFCIKKLRLNTEYLVYLNDFGGVLAKALRVTLDKNNKEVRATFSEETGKIHGKITLDNVPFSGGKIEIANTGYGVIDNKVPNKDGTYNFENLQVGEERIYQITAYKFKGELTDDWWETNKDNTDNFESIGTRIVALDSKEKEVNFEVNGVTQLTMTATSLMYNKVKVTFEGDTAPTGSVIGDYKIIEKDTKKELGVTDKRDNILITEQQENVEYQIIYNIGQEGEWAIADFDGSPPGTIRVVLTDYKIFNQIADKIRLIAQGSQEAYVDSSQELPEGVEEEGDDGSVFESMYTYKGNAKVYENLPLGKYYVRVPILEDDYMRQVHNSQAINLKPSDPDKRVEVTTDDLSPGTNSLTIKIGAQGVIGTIGVDDETNLKVVSGTGCTVEDEDTQQFTFTTTGTGDCVINSLPTGRTYTVKLTNGDYQPDTAKITLDADKEITFKLGAFEIDTTTTKALSSTELQIGFKSNIDASKFTFKESFSDLTADPTTGNVNEVKLKYDDDSAFEGNEVTIVIANIELGTQTEVEIELVETDEVKIIDLVDAYGNDIESRTFGKPTFDPTGPEYVLDKDGGAIIKNVESTRTYTLEFNEYDVVEADGATATSDGKLSFKGDSADITKVVIGKEGYDITVTAIGGAPANPVDIDNFKITIAPKPAHLSTAEKTTTTGNVVFKHVPAGSYTLTIRSGTTAAFPKAVETVVLTNADVEVKFNANKKSFFESVDVIDGVYVRVTCNPDLLVKDFDYYIDGNKIDEADANKFKEESNRVVLLKYKEASEETEKVVLKVTKNNGVQAYDQREITSKLENAMIRIKEIQYRGKEPDRFPKVLAPPAPPANIRAAGNKGPLEISGLLRGKTYPIDIEGWQEEGASDPYIKIEAKILSSGQYSKDLLILVPRVKETDAIGKLTDLQTALGLDPKKIEMSDELKRQMERIRHIYYKHIPGFKEKLDSGLTTGDKDIIIDKYPILENKDEADLRYWYILLSAEPDFVGAAKVYKANQRTNLNKLLQGIPAGQLKNQGP